MKKYIKYLIPLTLIFILSILIFIVNINNNNLKNNCYGKINIEDIFNDINSFNKDQFVIIENSEATNYLPIDYSKANKYIFGVNEQSNEFIVIIDKLDKIEYNLLSQYIDKLNEQIGEYTLKYRLMKEKDYIIVTALKEENSSYLGILRSYVYCE